jgi:hypothetical protein
MMQAAGSDGSRNCTQVSLSTKKIIVAFASTNLGQHSKIQHFFFNKKVRF